jgi:hypothetical protein
MILNVGDMASYLAAAGWQRRPDTWRGASIWDGPSGHEALVPARDGMDDAADRTWELLSVLTQAEGRPAEEIADDIASPEMDTQVFRTFPAEVPAGYIGLAAGVRAVNGVRDVLDAAVRAEIEGPRAAYTGRRPTQVGAVLEQARLGPAKPGSYVLMLRVPVSPPGQADLFDQAEPLPRRALNRMHASIHAIHTATTAVRQGGDYSGFDEAVELGVSADLCEGLSALGGVRRDRPFEIAFRWARAVPSDKKPGTIAFPENAAEVIFQAAKQLRHLAEEGPAKITGLVEVLHDEPARGDRWRVRVRGELDLGERGTQLQRPVWVRLDERGYNRAIRAHRQRQPVRATGRLQLVQRRAELFPERFEIID